MSTQGPILISVPHSGVSFPSEVRKYYKDEVVNHPEDTDWFVDRLYDFAQDMGIEVVVAPYSRYVIDLNRDPASKSLYSDGRSETSLTPSTNFLGESILKTPVDDLEAQRRIQEYYWPYYKNLEKKLRARVQDHGSALLFDAHSIKRNVKTIRKDSFPDMILGNSDETTASPAIIKLALDSLGCAEFQLNHNDPFKGGHITRYFGNLDPKINALQLEMSQDIYMNEETTEFDEVKAEKVRALLKPFFIQVQTLLENNENI